MIRRLAISCIVSVVLLPLSSLAVTTGPSVPLVMHISHPVPASHHLSRMLKEFATEVKARSDGELVVQLEGAEQAFKASQNIEAVREGKVEAAASTNFRWGELAPEVLALNLPYVFENLDDIRRFPASAARRFLDDRLADKGVKSLAWFYISRQTIFTSNVRPIVSVTDLKGMKVRGFNKLLDTGLASVGALPSAMPAPEVGKALASRKLDVAMTDVSAAYSRKFYEVQRYGTVSPNYMAIYFILYANPAWYDRLPEKCRKAIASAAAKAEADAIPITEQTAEDALQGLRENGMSLHVQPLRETTVWKQVMGRPTWLEFLRIAPERGQQILTLLSAI